MTEKQQQILRTALELFADYGYDATSTSKIAKTAGVSEGLLFRHFGNKEGLLTAIAELARNAAQRTFAALAEADDPRQVIMQALEIPRHLTDDDRKFWRLIYTLKWQRKQYDQDMVAPLRLRLLEAFGALRARNPEAEADLVLLLIDGMAMTVLLKQPNNMEAIYSSLLEKYASI